MFAIEVDRVFDGERAVPGGALVTVDGMRIVGVAPRGTPTPESCEVIRFPDATLLPGLIDSHVHLCCDGRPGALDRLPEFSDSELAATIEEALRAHLAAGVTTVRDLGDRRWAVIDWRDRNQLNTALPTVLGSGPPITSPNGHCSNMGGQARGGEQLRRAVAERAQRGVDLVKIMASGGVMTPGTDVARPQFSAEELETVVHEAHARGLNVTAHAHALNAIRDALAAGIDAIEHCTFMTETGIDIAADVVADLVTTATFVCPTLGLAPQTTFPPGGLELLRKAGMTYEAAGQAWAGLHKAGVRMVSGSDGGIGPHKRHGILPDAVIQLADGGVSASDALATATSIAADACGVADRKGRLSVGLDADLLVVGSNPLDDITALRNVQAVYLRGDRRV
jgi:imidazolonepropionase-like amidohydrolase